MTSRCLSLRLDHVLAFPLILARNVHAYSKASLPSCSMNPLHVFYRLDGGHLLVTEHAEPASCQREFEQKGRVTVATWVDGIRYEAEGGHKGFVGSSLR